MRFTFSFWNRAFLTASYMYQMYCMSTSFLTFFKQHHNKGLQHHLSLLSFFYMKAYDPKKSAFYFGSITDSKINDSMRKNNF